MTMIEGVGSLVHAQDRGQEIGKMESQVVDPVLPSAFLELHRFHKFCRQFRRLPLG